MKNKYFYIFFLCLNSFLYSQQSGWFWQNPLPQGNTVVSIKFVNSLTGYAAAEYGILLKTTNSGYNWFFQTTEMNLTTSDIHFFNNNTGIAVGENGATGIIKRTTDAGISWQMQHSSAYNPFWCVKFVNNNTGYAGGSDNSILKSTNGGINWFSQGSGINGTVKCLSFTDANTGFAAGQNKIFKTNNGGNNWIEIFNKSTWSFNSVSFADASTGIFLKANGKILRTTNSGNSWDSVEVGIQSSLNCVYYLNINDVFIAGSTDYSSNAKILRSTNSGLNWIIQDSYSKDNLLTITAADPGTLVAAGDFGKMLRYSNGESNWISVSSGFSNGMNDVDFFNSNTGFALRNKYFHDNNSGIIKTTNGGYNWIFYPIGTTNNLKAMSFVNESTGFVVSWHSSSNTIFRTSNGGVNWSGMNPGVNASLEDVHFNNPNTGFVVGGIYIFKSTNSGTTWTQQIISSSLRSISFTSADTGYVVSETGAVIKTTNCGLNWVIKNTLNYGLSCMSFINNNTGWVGAGLKIYKTTNGGDNWQLQNTFSPGGITSISMVDENIGYVVNSIGTIYYTYSSGLNWEIQKSYTGAWLTTVDFINQNTGWIVGYDGVILHTTTGGLSALTSLNNEIPIDYSLSQNYPNPFNPVTNIKFDIPKLGMVKITVFDLLGREVTNLINQQLQPGSYTVDWDASNYPSGVYFYKIIVGDNTNNEVYIESKKMVLVK